MCSLQIYNVVYMLQFIGTLDRQKGVSLFALIKQYLVQFYNASVTLSNCNQNH